MSAVYENEEKQVCVQLADNDYVLIMNVDKSVILKVTNKNGKLRVDTIKENNSTKESKK